MLCVYKDLSRAMELKHLFVVQFIAPKRVQSASLSQTPEIFTIRMNPRIKNSL